MKVTLSLRLPSISLLEGNVALLPQLKRTEALSVTLMVKEMRILTLTEDDYAQVMEP